MSDQSQKRVRLAPAPLSALFGFGAVTLSICDGFHTHSGTTSYPNPVALMAAWWTPLIFGLAVGAGGPAYAILYQLLGGRKAPPSWLQLAPAFVAFCSLYYFSGFYHGANPHETNVTKLAVLGGAALVLYALLDRTVAGALCLVATALTGPCVESILVHLGAFLHLQPDVLGVPMWLPALYACSAPVVGQGARRVLLRERGA